MNDVAYGEHKVAYVTTFTSPMEDFKRVFEIQP